MKIYVLCTLKPRLDCIKVINREFPIEGLVGLSKQEKNDKISGYIYLKGFCQKNIIRFITVEDYSLKNENDRKKLEKLDIDLLLVLGWQRLIPDWLIDQCRIGVIGVHGSAYGIENGRGRSPQNWALIMGKKKYYHSIFFIEKEADCGKIIDSMNFSLKETDDIETSYLKEGSITADLIIKNLKNRRIENKKGSPQRKQGYYLPKREPNDGAIDWNRSTKAILDFIRGQTKPYPGAFSQTKEFKLIIWKARPFGVISKVQAKNGQILNILEDNRLVIKTGDGKLLVDEYSLQSESKKNRLEEGAVLPSANFAEQMKEIVKRHNKKYGHLPLNKDILNFASRRKNSK